MATFQDQLEQLQRNPSEVVRECEDFRERAVEWFREVVQEAENGIRGTPEVDLKLMGQDDVKPVYKLIAYSIRIKVENGDIDPQNIIVEGELGEVIDKYLHEEDLLDKPSGRHHSDLVGFLNSVKCSVSVFVLPERFTDTFQSVPPILTPLINWMISDDSNPSKTSQMERFYGLINHEMTHAYIAKELGINWRIKYKADESFEDLDIKSIDEAACQAVSSVMYPGQEMNVEYYQSQLRYNRADLQFFKTLFMIYARRFDSKQERVSKIRERAVRAAKRIRRTDVIEGTRWDVTKLPLIQRYTLTEAVLGDKNRSLEKFRKVLMELEKVEQKIFHPLMLLDIIEAEGNKKIIHPVANEIIHEEDALVESISNPEGRSLDLFPEKVEKIYVDKEEGHMEKQEFEDSLYEIRKGLQHLLAFAEKESLSEEESQDIKQAVDDVEKAIEIYKEEKKTAKSLESEIRQEYEEDHEKIARWIKKRVTEGKHTDPVRIVSDLEVETEQIVDDYSNILQVGEEYNRKIMERMKSLHGEEGAVNILREHGVDEEPVETMIELTEHVYQICKNSQEKFSEAHELLERCEEHLEDVKEI